MTEEQRPRRSDEPVREREREVIVTDGGGSGVGTVVGAVVGIVVVLVVAWMLFFRGTAGDVSEGGDVNVDVPSEVEIEPTGQPS